MENNSEFIFGIRPVIEAISQVDELIFAARGNTFLGTSKAMIACVVGPVNALTIPVRKMTK